MIVKSILVNILRIRYVEDVLESPTLFLLLLLCSLNFLWFLLFNITFDANAKGSCNQVSYDYVQYEQGQ